MKLSTKGRYGVKAMVDLAVNHDGKPVSIKSISQRQNISEYYLEQLFAPLRRAEFIKSVRGAQGGYILNKEAKDITVLDIMDVLEGPIEVSDCLDNNDCDNMDYCATRTVWVKMKDSIDSVLGAITLQNIVDDYQTNKESIQFISKGKGEL